MKQKSLVFVFLAASFPAASAATTLAPSTLGRVTFQGSKGSPGGYSFSAAGTSALPVGDSSDNNSVHSALFNFSLNSSTKTEIASASQILFSVTPSGSGGIGANIRLVALTTDLNTIDGPTSVAAGTTVATIPFASVTTGTPLVFDVTSFVKADALAGNFTSFRLESTYTSAGNTSGVADIVSFNTIATSDAQLQIIPEPSSALLFGTTGALVLLRKRRHA